MTVRASMVPNWVADVIAKGTAPSAGFVAASLSANYFDLGHPVLHHLVTWFSLYAFLSSWELGLRLSKEERMSPALRSCRSPHRGSTARSPFSKCPSVALFEKKLPWPGKCVQLWARACLFCNVTLFSWHCKGRSIKGLLSHDCKWCEILMYFVHVHNIFTSSFHNSNLKWLYHFIIRKLEVILYLWKLTFHPFPEK